MTKEISESRLIDGIKQRDNTCFEYLYKKSYPFVSRFIIQSGGSADDVKDVLQDSLVIVYENTLGGKFRGDSGLLTYLNSICHHRWLTFLERRKRKNILVGNYLDFMNLIYEDDQEEELVERAKYAESLLSASSDRCKEILVAYYYENLSMDQIAGKLGYTNADSAKNQKAKCMDKIRKAVKNLATNKIHYDSKQ